jgi:hypothetical protein
MMMRVLCLFFLLTFARTPSYQKCLSALANFEGYDGKETLTVSFPPDYSEEELKQTGVGSRTRAIARSIQET